MSWDSEGNWTAKGGWGTAASDGGGFSLDRWQARLDELRDAHRVPGATLAVLKDGEVHELASGVLHRGTGVEATTDSVFLSGSVAKVYTATLVMQLVDSGDLDLDAPVVDIVPEFATPDAEATKAITVRQLLSHTGGLTCDFTFDSGRGDDCLAKYVEAAQGVAPDCPPGTAISYSSLGYVVLGRIVEVLTGQTWDEALRDRLLAPLDLEHTMTLPEEALRFRVAMSHLGEPGTYPDPAPVWDFMPRSAGPYGRVIYSAGDAVRFAQMHLNGGTAPDGTRVLSAESVAAMQTAEVDCPDKWTVSADGWGLGWTLYDWDGISGYGHDGSAVAQHSYLRVVPQAGVAIALLTNGGDARALYSDLLRELLAELASVRMPDDFAPAAQPPTVDMTPLVGTYKREGVLLTVSQKDDGSAHLLYEFVDGMKDMSPPLDIELVPVTESVFAGTGAGPSFSEGYMPVVFSILTDGTRCVYVGMRATPKTI
ncbi:serine hydrolase domain-containing protein [Streptomyces sp. NPDC048142]|uniref:serine hydrolase domain-containing protein n=1 Tax=Streptomyces sp. NPDC048142 TaxID=3365501 RepID=UPI003722472E